MPALREEAEADGVKDMETMGAGGKGGRARVPGRSSAPRRRLQARRAGEGHVAHGPRSFCAWCRADVVFGWVRVGQYLGRVRGFEVVGFEDELESIMRRTAKGGRRDVCCIGYRLSDTTIRTVQYTLLIPSHRSAGIRLVSARHCEVRSVRPRDASLVHPPRRAKFCFVPV